MLRSTILSGRFSRLIMVFALLSLLSCTAPEAPVVAGNCLAEKQWFPHSKTPRPDDKGFKSSSNCEFHQWSWQMFLWLTQKVKGEPRFLSFQSPESLLGESSSAMMPRTGKSAAPKTLDEYLQAGTDGILIDHRGRSVYYSQYVNPTFADFISKHNLTDPQAVQNFNPDTAFDISSMELKVAWKIVESNEDSDDFFTMQTSINRLLNKGGKIVIDPESTQMATVALVGFHIGGVVNGHPEMVWATFEHKSNAPNVPQKPTPDSIVSERDWLFYTADTRYADCNVNPADSPLLKLDDKSQVLSPVTEVCRHFEFGNDPENPASKKSSMQKNDDNIASINRDVHANLGSDNLWANYHEVGAIWFLNKNQLKPGLSLATDGIGTDQELTGSLKLSNSTIETFTQTQSTVNNCFRCHNTLHRFPPETALDPLPALNLNISHAFVNIYFHSQALKDQAKETTSTSSQ